MGVTGQSLPSKNDFEHARGLRNSAYAVNLTYETYRHIYINWASEASPTLVCSIEISRDIYIYIYIYMLSVCLVCQITWNHVNQTRAYSKSVLGGKIRPVTPILFVSSIC